MATSLPAQPASATDDAAAIKSTLALAESEHRNAYDAFDFAEAIAIAHRGLALAERAGSLVDQVAFLRRLAYDSWAMGENESALEYSQRVLTAAEQLNDNSLRSSGHRYFSLIYDSMRDNPRSRTHADQALRYAKLTGDEDLRIHALSSIARCQENDRQLDKAERAYLECETYWKMHGNSRNAANVAAHLADIAALRGDLPGALKRYEEIYLIRVALKDPHGQVRVLSAIADLLRQFSRNDEALARLTAVRPLAEKTGGHRVLAQFYESLARAQEASSDFRSALATSRLADIHHDALNSQLAQLRAEALETQINQAKNQQSVDRLIREMSRREADFQLEESHRTSAAEMRLALAGVLLLTSVLVLIIVVQRVKLRTARQTIAAAHAAPSPTGPK